MYQALCQALEIIILKRDRKEAGFYIHGERMHKLLRKIDVKNVIVQCEDYFFKSVYKLQEEKLSSLSRRVWDGIRAEMRL